jgi:Ca-activated chloride channel family protein
MPKTLVLVTVLAFAVAVGASAAGTGPQEDRTLSPYFLVRGGDPATEKLPLISTSAEADIAGVIADVRVVQKYKNEGRKPIEAIYVFPASTRAAVYGMKMTVGERVIVAEVQEREQARESYEQALRDGRTASLLEQQRPNVFQMNVGNILPGDTIIIELSYTELLVPTDGVYEFAYPAVVGPRYSNKPAAGAADNDRWVENPYRHEGEAAPHGFDIGVRLAAGMAIAEMTCPSHKTNISYDGPATADCRLAETERAGGNRDFVLRYRLAGSKVESGLLLFPGERENFFLAMVQPPKRVTSDQVPGREYVFIVDVSGSMYGFPLEVAKKLLRDLITGLRPTDRFNVLLFAGGNSVLAGKSLAATEANIGRAVKLIEEQQGGGSTELLPALRRALALERAEGASRSMVVVTDGYVDVEAEAFDLIRQNLGDANLFAFGIGSGVNRFLIEGMARVGMGEPFVVTDERAAPAAAEKFRRYIATPVLTGVRVEFSGFDAYDVEPAGVPDVLAERPVIVFGKYRGAAKGRITVSGRGGRGSYRQVLEAGRFAPSAKNAALRYLWARHRIQLLDDYNNLRPDDKRVKEVTALGLEYNLLTSYTSFVAIDVKVRNDGGKPVVVKQPLPLPAGVSDYAVGGEPIGMGMAPGMKLGRGHATGRPVAALPELDAASGQGRAGVVSVKSVKVAAAGGADASVLATDLELALEDAMADLEAAWAAERATNPALAGELTVKLTVGADGRVTKVEYAAARALPFPKKGLSQGLRDAVAAILGALEVENESGTAATVTVVLRFES